MSLNVRKPLECQDGTTLSVQVGPSLYCTPRQDEGPWTHVEVGFVTRDGQQVPIPGWDSWADVLKDDGTSDVYAYVPVAAVENFIRQCGGRKTWS